MGEETWKRQQHDAEMPKKERFRGKQPDPTSEETLSVAGGHGPQGESQEETPAEEVMHTRCILEGQGKMGSRDEGTNANMFNDPEQDNEWHTGYEDQEFQGGRTQTGRGREEGREEEITVDLDLRARGNTQPDKASGPEVAVVTEMLKELLVDSSVMVSTQVRGECDSPSWKIVQLVCPWKPDAPAEEGGRSYRAIAIIPAMAKWCSSVVALSLQEVWTLR